MYDRLLVLALSQHDMDLCPSGAGPEHYRDECDGDTTDIEPEVIERTCIYLYAHEERQEELQKETPEKGLLVGWRDGSAVDDGDDRFDEKRDPGYRENESGDQ